MASRAIINVLTKMSEKRRVKAMREGLFESFPNPERNGCPGPEIMRAIVAGKMAQGEEDKWVDHFVLCSPCSKEFYEIRCGHIRKKRFRAGAIASCVALVVVLAVWGWLRHQGHSNSANSVAQGNTLSAFRVQVLDLKNWSGERTDGGSEGVPKAPLELHRWHTSLVIYLPLGSEPGQYHVRIVGRRGVAVELSGVARIEDGNTVFRGTVDLNKLQAGQYSLGIRQPPWDWRNVPLILR
jgi:hypothetical protein